MYSNSSSPDRAVVRALVKDGAACGVRRIAPPPEPEGDEVVVRVAWAGICRTDLYAAEGRLPAKDGIVLGHEAAGVVHAVGPHAGLRVGDHVTVVPRVRCGACASCASGGSALACRSPAQLGIDRDGVFADHVRLPASSVVVVPRDMPLRLAAYVEPVAAALAVLSVGVAPSERIVVFGKSRIAELTRRVLVASGAQDVTMRTETEALGEGDAFDLAIETVATSSTLETLLRSVRRSGRVVLKSRPFEPVALDVSAAVEKEITIHAVRYAAFTKAIAWLHERRIVVDDLLGGDYSLEHFAEAFGVARQEKTKPFFAIG